MMTLIISQACTLAAGAVCMAGAARICEYRRALRIRRAAARLAESSAAIWGHRHTEG
jgi:hypothetical protein